MYIKEFTLKQHTPIIHFQANDSGATLRASEVKPKLDRFIVDNIPKYWKNIHNQFSNEIKLIKKAIDEKKSSLYAMSIKVEDSSKNTWYYFDNTKPSKKSYDSTVKNIQTNLQRSFNIQNVKIVFKTPLFSNRDKVKDKKWNEVMLGVKNNSDIKLKIKTRNEQILKLLIIVIPIFLTFENFGNRQNKGFGSFHIEDFSLNELKKILKAKYNIVKYKNFSEDLPFKKINDFYKLIKNDPLNVEKIKLKNYYWKNKKEERYYWEKNATSEFATNNTGFELEEDERYVRAILGLANLYDYPQNKPKKQLIISDLEEKIERFKSPITFKVVDKCIYLFCDDVPKEMLGKTFKFSDSKTKNSFEIDTPDYFNPKEFLNQLKEWKTL